MSKLSFIAVVGVLAAMLLAAGCGSKSSSEPSASDWADGLCTAVSTWTTSLQATVDDVKQNGISKDSLTNAIDDAKKSTQTFTDSLDDLGRPNTDSGQQAQDAVNTLSSEIKTDLQTIEDAVSNASGIVGITSAVTTIQQTISKAGTQVKDTVSTLQGLDAKGELEQAFKDAPSCQKLSSSGS